MPRPTPASRVMPIDWSTRPSSSIATHSEVKSPPRAAVLLGHDQAEQPQVAHLADQLDREVVVAVPLRDVRRDLGLGELPDHLAEQLVILGQLEHDSSSRRRCGTAA